MSVDFWRDDLEVVWANARTIATKVINNDIAAALWNLGSPKDQQCRTMCKHWPTIYGDGAISAFLSRSCPNPTFAIRAHFPDEKHYDLK